MADVPEQPDYRLRLRPLASDVPATIRLRSVLKRLLRTYQFRVVVVEEVRAEAPATPAVLPGDPSEVTS
jgi:hypothetical protein